MRTLPAAAPTVEMTHSPATAPTGDRQEALRSLKGVLERLSEGPRRSRRGAAESLYIHLKAYQTGEGNRNPALDSALNALPNADRAQFQLDAAAAIERTGLDPHGTHLRENVVGITRRQPFDSEWLEAFGKGGRLKMEPVAERGRDLPAHIADRRGPYRPEFQLVDPASLDRLEVCMSDGKAWVQSTVDRDGQRLESSWTAVRPEQARALLRVLGRTSSNGSEGLERSLSRMCSLLGAIDPTASFVETRPPENRWKRFSPEPLPQLDVADGVCHVSSPTSLWATLLKERMNR
jgi:hypothetical protein